MECQRRDCSEPRIEESVPRRFCHDHWKDYRAETKRLADVNNARGLNAVRALSSKTIERLKLQFAAAAKARGWPLGVWVEAACMEYLSKDSESRRRE